MKPKITPAEYRNTLEALELSSISLIDGSQKLKEENITQTLTLEINEKYSFEQQGNTLILLYNYKLTAQNSEKPDPAVTLSARYKVKYSISKEVVITKDFMKIFCDLTAGMLLWTYFREYVSNIIYRMGMPQLTLGLKKR